MKAPTSGPPSTPTTTFRSQLISVRTGTPVLIIVSFVLLGISIAVTLISFNDAALSLAQLSWDQTIQLSFEAARDSLVSSSAVTNDALDTVGTTASVSIESLSLRLASQCLADVVRNILRDLDRVMATAEALSIFWRARNPSPTEMSQPEFWQEIGFLILSAFGSELRHDVIMTQAVTYSPPPGPVKTASSLWPLKPEVTILSVSLGPGQDILGYVFEEYTATSSVYKAYRPGLSTLWPNMSSECEGLLNALCVSPVVSQLPETITAVRALPQDGSYIQALSFQRYGMIRELYNIIFRKVMDYDDGGVVTVGTTVSHSHQLPAILESQATAISGILYLMENTSQGLMLSTSVGEPFDSTDRRLAPTEFPNPLIRSSGQWLLATYGSWANITLDRMHVAPIGADGLFIQVSAIKKLQLEWLLVFLLERKLVMGDILLAQKQVQLSVANATERERDIASDKQHTTEQAAAASMRRTLDTVANGKRTAGVVSFFVFVITVGCAVALSVLTTRPIRKLLIRMERAANMDIQPEDVDLPAYSALLEIRLLQEYFSKMAYKLRLYRSYMPEAVFANTSHDDEDDTPTEEKPTDVQEIQSVQSGFTGVSASPVNSDSRLPNLPHNIPQTTVQRVKDLATVTVVPRRASLRSKHSRSSSRSSNGSSSSPNRTNSSANRASASSAPIRSKPQDRSRTPRGNSLDLGLTLRRCAVAWIQLVGFKGAVSHGNPNHIAELQGAFMQAVTTIVRQHKGVVNTVGPGSALVSWNAANCTSFATRKAAEAMLQLTSSGSADLAALFPDKQDQYRIVAGLVIEKAWVGNLGIASSRAFMIIGTSSELARQLATLNQILGSSVLSTRIVQRECAGTLLCRTMDRIQMSVLSDDGTLVAIGKELSVVEVSSASLRNKNDQMDDWMYTLVDRDDLPACGRYGLYERAWEEMGQGQPSKAKEYLQKHLLKYPNDNRAHQLVRWCESVESNPSTSRGPVRTISVTAVPLSWEY